MTRTEISPQGTRNAIAETQQLEPLVEARGIGKVIA
jgi:hypothetical protein